MLAISTRRSRGRRTGEARRDLWLTCALLYCFHNEEEQRGRPEWIPRVLEHTDVPTADVGLPYRPRGCFAVLPLGSTMSEACYGK